MLISRVIDNFRQYCKIPKISPGAYIFQRPFLRGLFLERLIFRGAYLWREIGSCLLWVMLTEISVDIAVDIAVDSRLI